MRTLIVHIVLLVLTHSGVAFGKTVSLNDTSFVVGDKLPVFPIIYVYDKPDLLPSSFPFLDSIAAFLMRNPNICLEVGGHTDLADLEKYSRCFTLKRAESVVAFLVGRGIERERLLPKGYSDSEILISPEQIEKLPTKEEKEKAHLLNRRTEFKIIRTDYR